MCAGVHLLLVGAFPQAQVCLSAQACGFGCTHCTGAYACEDVCIQTHVGGYMIAHVSVNVCVSGGEDHDHQDHHQNHHHHQL